MRPTSSCGRRLSEAAFGHTGFTGTSLWIDPTPVRQGPRLDSQPSHGEGLYVVFLSNRVHPSRTGEGIGAVRQALHDALIEDLG
jgi:CubicO group peptidase (beta-lactamase class C family)